ncbi:uncharacterized protein ATC70_012966 [Mucor velutinosus]|uniref:Thyroglobulin type-1 domain-containing protein n=1 Tax=Mucor velutinosus TaxID=708070 RepID=A0AAN7HYS0_9FUNG|nr:hypothetical protein ATC70_012966 [Mucor velutinosus]
MKYFAVLILVSAIFFTQANAQGSTSGSEEKHKEALDTGMVGIYVSTCESNGSYTKLQCVRSTGACLCADDPTSGSFIRPAESADDC